MQENVVKTLTTKQIAAYGAVAYNRLKNSGNLIITEKLLYSYILTLLELHDGTEIENIYSNFILNKE